MSANNTHPEQLTFPKVYLQAEAQTQAATVQHLSTVLQMPQLETAWSYTTMDALRDTEQLLLMSAYSKTDDQASTAILKQIVHEPAYPRHYARWVVLEHAKAALVHFDANYRDVVVGHADKLIAMVPQAERDAPTVSLRHTFAPVDAPWLEGRTFVLTGELSEMDREAATALLQSQGAHVRTSVTRFTDFVVAGPLLRDGRLVTEGSKYKRMVELNTRRPNTQQWAQLVMEPQLRAMVPKKAWAKARKETEARRREAKEAVEAATARERLLSRQADLQADLDTLSTQLRQARHEIVAYEKEYPKGERQLERLFERLEAVAQKKRKPNGSITVNDDANKPGYISPELCKFIGKDVGTEMARTEVIKHVNSYIKEHGLQDAKNKRIILPDSKLQSLLKTRKSDQVDFFNLHFYLACHYDPPASRTYLDVPSSEATLPKMEFQNGTMKWNNSPFYFAGAKWDGERRQWYAPAGAPQKLLDQWAIKEMDIAAATLMDLSTSTTTTTHKRKRTTTTTPTSTDPPRRVTRSMAKRRRHDA